MGGALQTIFLLQAEASGHCNVSRYGLGSRAAANLQEAAWDPDPAVLPQTLLSGASLCGTNAYTLAGTFDAFNTLTLMAASKS